MQWPVKLPYQDQVMCHSVKSQLRPSVNYSITAIITKANWHQRLAIFAHEVRPMVVMEAVVSVTMCTSRRESKV